MAPYYGSTSKRYSCVVCRPPPELESFDLAMNLQTTPAIPALPGGAIFHKHHSTSFFFKQMQVRNKMADCPTCLETHPPVNYGRIRLLSTSSTLHDVQFTETFPNELNEVMSELGLAPGSFHINIDSIPGGRIHNLSYSWFIGYSQQSLPCDVYVAAGLNDVKHLTADQFMERLESWKNMVMDHSVKNQHMHPSTFAVSPILWAPRYYWHPSNPFSPPLGFVNYKSRIYNVNERIHSFNNANDSPKAVALHTMGDRCVRGKSITKWTSWREYHREVPVGREILPRSTNDISLMDNTIVST